MSIQNIISNLIDSVKNSPTGVSFVSLNNYTNSKGEVQNATINVGLSYERAKAKDTKFLQNLNVFEDERLKRFEDKQLLEIARLELLASCTNPNEKQSNAQKEAYTHLCNGLKIHNETKALYLQGYAISKKVIETGEEKTDTRKPLTKAKDLIRKFLKSSKYRQYNIENLKEVKINKGTIIIE